MTVGRDDQLLAFGWNSWLEVGLWRVGSLELRWLRESAGKRVGTAIAEVECCRMPAPSIPLIGLASQHQLVAVERHAPSGALGRDRQSCRWEKVAPRNHVPNHPKSIMQ